MPTRPRSESLRPREHGAYAQVAFPLLTALALVRPTLAGVLLAASIVGAFFLHESVLVLLGRRGPRAYEVVGDRARRVLASLGSIVVASAVAGEWMGGASVRVASLGAIPIAAVLGWMIATKHEKSPLGETFVACALAAASVPVALACGVAPDVALIAAAMWAVVYSLSTATVHALLSAWKRARSRPTLFTALAALLLGTGAIAATALRGEIWPLAIIPTVAVTLVAFASAMSPKHLMRLGWSLVASNAVSAMLLLAGLRA